MKINFDSRGKCTYISVNIQRILHELKERLLADDGLEVLALWRVKPRCLGENNVPESFRREEKISILLEAFANDSAAGAVRRKRPVRYPGLVRASSKTISLLEEIQESKHALKDELKGLTPFERLNYWSQFPGWTGFEVLRDIGIIEQPKSVRFYWQHGAAHVRKSAAEWIIAKSRAVQNSKYNDASRRDRIIDLRNRELRYLESLQVYCDIVQWRPIQPSIRARVVFPGGDSKIYNTSLPTFFTGNTCVQIKPLDELFAYCPSGHGRNPAHARVKLAPTPIVEGSNLYHYIEDL